MQTGVLRRLRNQDEALLTALARVEVLALDPTDARLAEAVSDLGRRLRAHAVVSEELVLRRLRECPGPWRLPLADLEAEHEELRRGFESELEWEPCPGGEPLARFAARLRRHLARELSVLHQLGDAPRARLARLPAWRVDELYEIAGGLAETWPEKWLG